METFKPQVEAAIQTKSVEDAKVIARTFGLGIQKAGTYEAVCKAFLENADS